MSNTPDLELSDLELERVFPLESEKPDATTARRMTSLSADTLKRNYPKFVVKLSERREGMSLRNILKITTGKA